MATFDLTDDVSIRVLADAVEEGDGSVWYDETVRAQVAAVLRMYAGVEGIVARLAHIEDTAELYKIAQAANHFAHHAGRRRAARPFAVDDVVSVGERALPRRFRGRRGTILELRDDGMTRVRLDRRWSDASTEEAWFPLKDLRHDG